MKFSLTFKLIILLLVLAIPVLYVWNEYQRFMQSPVVIDEDNTVFTIEPGDNLSVISQRLFQQGISPTPSVYLDIYGRLQNQAQQIKAGEYEITAGTTMPALFEQFIDGRTLQHRLTIIEGMTAQQLLAKLRDHPKIKASDDAPDLTAIAKALDLPRGHAEGWFLPETYQFPSGTRDVDFLQRAYRNMQKTLETAWAERAEDLPYEDAYEALIMASIIEKETAAPDEREMIAGVFVRRLEKGMRLQTDPTVIYGIGDTFDGNIRRKDLRTDTPYNTYTRGGLPPTPICLPSKAAIHAALNPASGEYLYFVATGKDGRHKFSTNLRDHNNAVRKYQLKQ